MRVRGAASSALILGVLCLVCGASRAVAVAVPGQARSHRTRTRACHHTRHRRCPPARSHKRAARRHDLRRTAKSPKPKTIAKGPGSSSPWATVPATVGPGSSPGSTAAPGSPAGSAAPGESTTSPAAPARVEVTAEDTEAFRFVLSRPTVPAGRVIIEFVNHGQDEHNLNAVEPTEGSVAGSIPNTPPDAHPSLTVNLRRGSYTLFCSLPGHEAKGMKATLVVN